MSEPILTVDHLVKSYDTYGADYEDELVVEGGVVNA